MSITYDLRVVDLTSLSATGTVVDGIVSFNCADRLSDVTDFTLEVAYDATVVASLAAGKVLRLKLSGTVVWCGILERRKRHPIAAGEETEENITWTGRSIGSIMDRMAMRPAMGFGVEPWGPGRVFSFAEIHYDASGWSNAIELGTVLDVSAHWKRGEPSGFPGLNVTGIACTGDTDDAAAQGYRYYVKDFDPGATDTACAIFLSADNSADVYIDGFQLAQISAGADTTEGLRNTRAVTVFLTAATVDAPTHRIAARVVNVPFGGGDPGPGTGATLTGNPTRFLAVGYKVDAEGRLGDKLFETDDTWLANATPADPPGETFGEIAGINRNQQLATLTGLDMFTLGFGDGLDSTGVQAWTPIESWSTQVGDSWLKLMQNVGVLYAIWRIAYAAAATDEVRLDAWEIGTYSNDSGVTYDVDADPAVSTVRDLELDEIDVGTDALIVSFPGGQIRVPDTGGSRCGFVQLDAATVGEAKDNGQKILDTQGTPEQVTLRVAPTGTGDIPGKDWLVGDIIHTADGAGGLLDERGLEWTLAFTDLGDNDDAVEATNANDSTQTVGLAFTITIKDLHVEGAEALQRHIQSMSNGSLGGNAPAAPSGRPLPGIAKISAGEITFHEQRETIIGESPAHKTPTTSGNVYGVKASIPSLDEDGFDIITTTDTVVDLWTLDTPGGTPAIAATVTIPAGEWVGIAAVDPIVWLNANESEIWPEVTSAAAEAIELTVEPLTV